MLPRPVHIAVLCILFAFWTAVAVCVAVVFAMTAWDDRGDDGTRTVAPSATAVTSPTQTPEPRPDEVPLTAAAIDGVFDTGKAERHLFFHIGCVDGVLAIITTDEHVYAETFCNSIPQDLVVPFLGRPVRITISEGRLDLVSVDGARLQFGVQRAWVDQQR
jgi:hypothetical protein